GEPLCLKYSNGPQRPQQHLVHAAPFCSLVTATVISNPSVRRSPASEVSHRSSSPSGGPLSDASLPRYQRPMSRSSGRAAFSSFSPTSVTFVSLRSNSFQLLSYFNSFTPASVILALSRSSFCKLVSFFSSFSPASVIWVYRRRSSCTLL